MPPRARPSAPPAPRPLLLAIDTSTAWAGLALYDGEVAGEVSWPAGRHGSQTVLPEIDRLLALAGRHVAELTAVAVALGPGSFSALRVGLSAAKGLAYARGCPLIGIPTLDVVSYPHRHAGQTVWAVLNAGRARVVAAPYAVTDDIWQAGAPARHGPIAEVVAQMDGPALIGGEVPPEMIVALAARPDLTLLPPALRLRRPGVLAELAWSRLLAGQADDPVAIEPLYLHGDGGGQRALLS